MSYPLPSTDPNVWTVYSINPCPYCRKAKQLLTDEKENFIVIDCNDYRKNERENFLLFIHELTKSDHKTFPIIFHENKFIGGFDKLCVYYEEYKANKPLTITEDF